MTSASGPSDSSRRTNAAESKSLAAAAALEFLPEAGVIGLGSGSTARLFIDGVGRLVSQGRELVGVATSVESRRQAEALGIRLLPDEGPWAIDVCVDGADEVSARLDVIKGGGGCHTREKIVNAAARVNLIVVDDSKLSEQLGERWPVPVEVLPFGVENTVLALKELGTVRLRLKDGKPWLTDAGNFLYDVGLGVIEDPALAHAALIQIPGVVESGIFVGRADRVVVAGRDGVRILTR